jgi:hypothetical protein
MSQFLAPIDPGRVEFEIHFVGRGWMILPVRELPSVPECIEALSAAFRAWSVAGCEGDSFIHKEKLRVPVRRHDDVAPSFEFQHACDPASSLVTTHNFPLLIVQSTAAVPHHSSSSVRLDKFTKWVHTIPQGHS